MKLWSGAVEVSEYCDFKEYRKVVNGMKGERSVLSISPSTAS